VKRRELKGKKTGAEKKVTGSTSQKEGREYIPNSRKVEIEKKVPEEGRGKLAVNKGGWGLRSARSMKNG